MRFDQVSAFNIGLWRDCPFLFHSCYAIADNFSPDRDNKKKVYYTYSAFLIFFLKV